MHVSVRRMRPDEWPAARGLQRCLRRPGHTTAARHPAFVLGLERRPQTRHRGTAPTRWWPWWCSPRVSSMRSMGRAGVGAQPAGRAQRPARPGIGDALVRHTLGELEHAPRTGGVLGGDPLVLSTLRLPVVAPTWASPPLPHESRGGLHGVPLPSYDPSIRGRRWCTPGTRSGGPTPWGSANDRHAHRARRLPQLPPGLVPVPPRHHRRRRAQRSGQDQPCRGARLPARRSTASAAHPPTPSSVSVPTPPWCAQPCCTPTAARCWSS